MYLIPQNYGNSTPIVVRKGKHYGNLTEQFQKASNILTGYEENVEKAKQTQQLYQMLAVTGTIVVGLGGIFLTYKFITNLKK